MEATGKIAPIDAKILWKKSRKKKFCASDVNVAFKKWKTNSLQGVLQLPIISQIIMWMKPNYVRTQRMREGERRKNNVTRTNEQRQRPRPFTNFHFSIYGLGAHANQFIPLFSWQLNISECETGKRRSGREGKNNRGKRRSIQNILISAVMCKAEWKKSIDSNLQRWICKLHRFSARIKQSKLGWPTVRLANAPTHFTCTKNAIT